MLGCVVEIGGGAGGAAGGEEGGAAAGFLGEDDAVEKLDVGGVGGFGFAFVDEFVECCGRC